MKTNYITILASTVMLAIFMSFGSVVAQPWVCGTTTESTVMCKLNEDGTFTVSGNGAMLDYAFYNPPIWYDYRELITNVVIEDGVTHIGDYAFDDCTNLTSITIGASVATIETFAFSGYPNLNTIIIEKTTPPDWYRPFREADKENVSLYVPDGSVDAYKSHASWDAFDNILPSSSLSTRHSTSRASTANQPQITLRGRTLNVRVPQSSVESSHSIRVLDLRGRQIANFRMGETNARTFSLARIPAGKYFVEIRNANTRISSSSVVVR